MDMTMRFGLLPSPGDNRDFKIRLVGSPLKAVQSLDLSTWCTTVKNQGSVNSCTAFASIGCLEMLFKKVGKIVDNDMFSERFTYYATRVNILGWSPLSDNGAYIRDTIKSLVKYGCCLESTCPYSNDYKTVPTQAAYSEALNYQALTYASFEVGKSVLERQTTIETLKLALQAGNPIIGGFTVYSNITAAKNGVIPAANGQIVGGHAVLIVGYDDSTQLFKIRNSWGTAVNGGYWYLPYSYYFNNEHLYVKK